MIERGELVGRAVSTEVSSGLTCIADSVPSYDANSMNSNGGSAITGSGSMTSSTSAGSTTISSSSTGGVPIIIWELPLLLLLVVLRKMVIE